LPVTFPAFGRFLDALNSAGVETRSSPGFWGGVTRDGGIVLTIWTDAQDGNDRYYVWKPRTNHGGLKALWDRGEIRPGVLVRVIAVRQRGHRRIGEGGRSVADAALLPGDWMVSEMVTGKDWQAVVQPVASGSGQ
jgi:hypothetical protein